MSDFLSVAVVTAAMQTIIQQVLKDTVAGVTVRIGPPRAPGPAVGPEVNLYLYMVSPNDSLRNDDLPTRSHSGELLHRPAVAVDLHYIITFYGEQDLASERMMARLATHFHANPILSPDIIRTTISPSGSFHYLSESNLADAPEPVRLCPYYPTSEELSKLWTVFFQMAHRVSLQYTASPIVMDAAVDPIHIPTVVDRRFKFMPIRQNQEIS